MNVEHKELPQTTNYKSINLPIRLKVIALHLEEMGRALAGDVEPVVVAEFIMLSARLDRMTPREVH